MYKQRIVGGLVLVAVGAIVIPFLLDMHQEGQWWGKDSIPKKPDDGFVTRVLPLQEWSQQAQTELKGSGTRLEAATKAAKDRDQPPPETHADMPREVSPSSPASVSPPVSEGDGEGWVVQMGSFSNQKNAEELYQRLQQKGYRVFVDRSKQEGQTAYRVRIGPESQRTDAESLRARLESELKLKGIVLHTP